MSRDFSETDMFYIDLWPFASSYLIVNDPDAAMAVSSAKPPFPKAQHFKDMIDPIVGGPNMITANGAEWKLWRNVFNPAFSMANLMEQVPSIVDSARMFCQKLEERAQKGTVLPLEDIATRLTMDIIIKVVM